jgi:hypothetical protein
MINKGSVENGQVWPPILGLYKSVVVTLTYMQFYSGKHKTTGMKVQVVCTLDGELAWISDSIDGARHDTHCLRESGALSAETADNWLGDKGYVGYGLIFPCKKHLCRDLIDWEKHYNTQVNKNPLCSSSR